MAIKNNINKHNFCSRVHFFEAISRRWLNDKILIYSSAPKEYSARNPFVSLALSC